MLLVHGCLKLIMSNSYPSVGLPYFGAHILESFNFLGYEVPSKLGRCHTCIGVGIFLFSMLGNEDNMSIHGGKKNAGIFDSQGARY